MANGIKISAFVTFIITMLLIIFYHIKSVAIILTLAISVGTTCYHLGMRLLVGKMFDLLLNNKVDYKKKWFNVGEKERKLYDFLRVKKWKKYFPTYDPDTFDKRQHSWNEIIMAMCQAELVHETIVILSCVPIIFSVWFGSTLAFVITSVFAAMFDLMFVMIQRYNRPRVLKILK